MTQKEQESEENPNDLKFIEELQLQDYQEYEDLFKVVSDYKAGNVDRAALKEKLFKLRFRKLSDNDLDTIMSETELVKDGAVSFFSCIILLKKLIDAGTKEKFQRIVKKEGNGLFRVYDPTKYNRKPRPYSEAERNRLAKTINDLLKDDPDCQNGRVPIDPETDELFEKLKDGVILAKLVNLAEKDTIPEDEIKKDENMSCFDKYDNLEKAIEGAKKVGCHCETTADDVVEGDQGRDENLLEELLKRINAPQSVIKEKEELNKMLNECETREDLANLPVDDFLTRWFNSHLTSAGHPNMVTNYSDDVKDSEKYTVLLNDIEPKCDKSALDEEDMDKRAEKVLENAAKIGTVTSVEPVDISSGNEDLNKLFTSQLYNAATSERDENYGVDEMKKYVQVINKLLCDEGDCKEKIPMDPENEEEVFEKLKDGLVLAKLVSEADPNVLTSEDFKNKDQLLSKAVDGAHNLGCQPSCKPKDVELAHKKKTKELVGDILTKINAKSELIKKDKDCDDLCKEGETKDDLAKVNPDDFLLRWMNKHLKNAGHPNEATNFGEDVKDGEKYAVLLGDLRPTVVDKNAMLEETDHVKRLNLVIENAKKIGLDTVLTGEDLAGGNEKLNELFVSEVYNIYANPFDVDERFAFCRLINKLLEKDKEAKEKLPLDSNTNEIFKKIKDGILLGKLVNMISPNTIDDRALFKGPNLKREDKENNLNLCLNAGKGIGCLIETSPEEVLNEVRLKDLFLLHQILRQLVFQKINIQEFPQLLRLQGEKEEIEEMLTFGPEDLLMRWFNYHLKNTGHPNSLTNWDQDLKDSEKFTLLLNQLESEKCDKSALDEADQLKRAEKVLENAEKIGADVYISPNVITEGHRRLLRFFSAELFEANHGMGEATKEEKMKAAKMLEDDAEGEREERMYRIWINSLKLKDTKKVNNLYEDCRSAILLLKIIDKIKPGTVEWKYVELKTKNPIKVGVNCDEAIHACKRSGYKIVGINGTDIRQCNKKLILAIVWQLMRAHTLQVIGNKSENDLLSWANNFASDANKITSLRDKKLSTGVFWIEVLAGIEPKAVRWDFIVRENPTDKDREMNAKYAISVARGLGACIFIVWEDITEVKGKLLLTFLASLYDVADDRGKG